ncbi:hypothetical protein HEM55_023625 [Escherichia coli]|uniref:hypothetical protein n=1 Tax=Escherichia coli TaxID=562 RepID=UPI000BE90109|nr:hypothetical protein [Escherichia coli]EEW2051179.1 hypothetical protein [Escherichia coli]EFA7745717.1 hypothetical protein [Escherichia coli]EFD4999916.1 hypothetical protein [Escherichia coli]EFI3447787.1 hypothetical protein [Escherichia coli]EFO2846046.1 hypothetical protein [Escherichia coli]
MQHENDSDNEFRLSVFDTLKGTLNQHRQMAEEGGDEQIFKKDEEIESEHFVYRSRTRSGADHSDVTQVGSLDPEQHRKVLSNTDFESEIKLKRTYGIWLLLILAVQLAVMNVVFIVVGLNKLAFEALTLQLYMGGTLTEVFGLVLVITKYLFNRK